MNPAFADTSFYIASINPKDAWHESATAIGSSWRGLMVTTEYVLVEVGNHLCHPADRAVFLEFAELVQRDERAHIVPASSELLKAGLALFGKRPDKSWSLTDCISFAVMEARGLTDALSSDHHFEQAGFRLLLNR